MFEDKICSSIIFTKSGKELDKFCSVMLKDTDMTYDCVKEIKEIHPWYYPGSSQKDYTIIIKDLEIESILKIRYYVENSENDIEVILPTTFNLKNRDVIFHHIIDLISKHITNGFLKLFIYTHYNYKKWWRDFIYYNSVKYEKLTQITNGGSILGDYLSEYSICFDVKSGVPKAIEITFMQEDDSIIWSPMRQ